MSRQVVVERTVQDQLRRLAPQTKKKIKRALSSLAEIPAPPDRTSNVKRLDAPDQGEPVYRLRIGDYRGVFVVRSTEVRVVRVFHREEGYDWLRRLKLD